MYNRVMKNAIKVKLAGERCAGVDIPEPEPRYVIVNENQICWIDSGKVTTKDTEAVLHMSNGDVILISEPTYSAWENDSY